MMKKKRNLLVILGLGLLFYVLGSGEQVFATENKLVNEIENSSISLDQDGNIVLKQEENCPLGTIEDELGLFFEKYNIRFESEKDKCEFYLNHQYGTPDERLVNMPNYTGITLYILKYLENMEQHLYLTDDPESFDTKIFLGLNTADIVAEQRLQTEADESISAQGNRAGIISQRSTANPSLSKGKAYAKKYYKTRNSGYKSYGANCTNFVSQVLRGATCEAKTATGTEALLFKTTKYWYHYKFSWTDKYGSTNSSFKVTTSFINVNDFYSFWGSRKSNQTYTRANSKKAIAYASAGDVIQYKKDGIWYHTGFVYRKSASELYVSMNSSDYLERKLSDSLKDKSISHIRIIKMGMK